MSDFSQYKSYINLKTLSKDPLDLSIEGVLTQDRISSMTLQADEHFKLLYATERVDEKVLKGLFHLAKDTKVVEKMHAMQKGEKINKSENHAVLHTATRDIFVKDPINAKATEQALKELNKLKKFLGKIDKENRFCECIQIGIGGSDLGPRSIYKALKAYALPNRKAYFISNVDPDNAYKVLKKVKKLKNTLIISVSKSGTTLETKTNEEIIRRALENKGLDPKEHIVSVTAEKSPMDDPSKYLASFYIWDYIGGRFSTTSMMGAVMLGFTLGYDNLIEILKGAEYMDKKALLENEEENIALFSSLLTIWNRNFLKIPTLAVIPYSEALKCFISHLQQCEMESNGKAVDINGCFLNFQTSPILWGNIGTDSQHSFFQMLHQGTDIAAVEFIGFKESQYKQDWQVQKTTSQEKLLSNLFAQAIALAKGKKSDNLNQFFYGNRPSHILLAKRLTPFIMGSLLAYFEHKFIFEGFIWGINSFDQEGVQLGKVLANKMIDLFKGKEDFPLGKAYLQQLENF